MEIKQQEKRLNPRLKFSAPLRYQLRGDAQSHEILSDNISRGGVGFVSQGFIAPAQNLMLQINILSRVVNFAAVVAWTRPIAHSDRYRLGLEFTEANPKDRQYVGDFIDTLLGRF